MCKKISIVAIWGKKYGMKINMKFKQLLDFSNAYAVSIIEAMEKMGLDVSLLGFQMSQALNHEAKDLIEEAGLKIEGNDIKTITESFVASLKEVGVCQIAKVESMDDNNIEIHLGECILAPATLHVRNTRPDITPPCPFIALLVGQIGEKCGKQAYIDTCEWKPQENTDVFKIKLE